MSSSQSPTDATSAALRRTFAPRSIAVVGASEDASRIGGTLLANVRFAFEGAVTPVSRSRSEVQGLPAVARLAEVDPAPDLALIAVASEHVEGVLEEAAAAGCGGAVIYSAGFAETGEEGRAQQRRFAEIARAADMRLLGPNTIGFIEPRHGVYASFLHNAAQEGAISPVALITQSGAIGAYLLRMMRAGGLGVGLQCSTGNEADLTATDVIEMALEDPEIKLVLTCIESASSVPRLIEVGRRARELGKRILMLKIGDSSAGARAAASHSGALSSDAAAFAAAMRHAGIVTVSTVAELAGFGSLFLADREPAGRRLGLVTTSGGLGIHMADQASKLGLEVPALPDADQAEIGAALPSYASAANPVDVTANIVNDPDSLRTAASGLMRSGGVDMALIYATNVGAAREESSFSAIEEAYGVDPKPMIALTHDDASATAMIARGVPAVADASIAVRALATLADVAAREPGEPRAARDEGDPAVARARELLAAGGSLTPDAAFELLDAFGVPSAPHGVATSAAEATAAAERIGGPVALKLAVGEIAHKSDVGGVVLGLEGDEVGAAAERLLAIAAKEGLPPRLLVQAMAAPGLELFAGAYRAPEIGPVLVFGLGGTTVEIVEETCTVLAAAGPGELREALGELAGGRLLTHRRGLSASAADKLVDLLGRLGDLTLSVPELAELDLNPIVVTDDEVTVVDAVAVASGD
jgi:acetate---CoA ligase (ADP-forming)